MNMYKDVVVDGNTYKFSALLWDDNNVVRYAIGSFYTRQTLDSCLALMQSATSMNLDGTRVYTQKKGYKAMVAKSIDENKCDGVHTIINTVNDRALIMYDGDSAEDSLEKWISINTECGIIPEWKYYFYEQLKARGLLHECRGFDFIGVAPKIVIIDKQVDTKVLRSIKAYGLKSGSIKLPVTEVQNIPQDMPFLDIITELIIPYLQEQNCSYNIGDKISPVFETPIIMNGKSYTLFPKQKVLAQGLLNSIKEGNPYVVFNGGCGVGKTVVSAKLVFAIMQEVLKKEKGRIGLLCQGHLINKWERQLNECLNPIGVYPNFYKINKYTDIKKIPKNPKGIDILLFPKDKVKRKWLVEHSSNETPYMSHFDISKEELKESIILKEYCGSIKSMKVAAIHLEKTYKKKVVLYQSCKNVLGSIECYKVVTTSSTIKSLFNKTNKSYDFTINTIEEIKNLISERIDDILDEKVIKTNLRYENYIRCPYCGGKIYDNESDVFDEEGYIEYNRFTPKNLNESNKCCNNYIKADGTSLTEYERRAIRQHIVDFKVVTETLKYAYLDEEGNAYTGKELNKLKQRPSICTILLKKCNHKLWGAKNDSSYKCIPAISYYIKLFGKRSIDVSLIDEAHQYSLSSNQGEAFASLVRASKYSIPLSGSISGGKASDLFYFLFRLSPRSMLNQGYGYKDVSLFIDHFGRRKQETIDYKDFYNRSGRRVKKAAVEIPGISPLLYAKMLTNHMVSRKIEDMNLTLPKLRYFKHEIEMTEELKKNYNSLEHQFKSFMAQNMNIPIGGSLINNLLCYCDMPEQPTITTPRGTVIAEPPHMNINDILLPKELDLVRTIKKELKEGRRTLVYATYTGEKGVSKRLVSVLSKYFKVAELKGQKIKLEKREEWIEEQYQKGIECIVLHPETVSTGLDIVQYPTIYFYEIPFNIRTLLQSEKRGYRANSTRECRIYYSFYKSTLQADAILLASQKKVASLSLEGVFSEDMLSAMSGVNDSIESKLNQVLKGTIKLKESDLDKYGFESEEVNYSFNNTEDGDVEVTKTSIDKVIMSKQEVTQLNIFTIDEEFMKKLGKKKKNIIPVEGQIGFML